MMILGIILSAVLAFLWYTINEVSMYRRGFDVYNWVRKFSNWLKEYNI